MAYVTRLLLFMSLLWFALGGPATAGKRVAFVAGIDRYDNLDPVRQLKKAVNDARAVGDTFAKLGFDIIRTENSSRLELVREWQRFLNSVNPGDTAAFFFAGHGVEIGGLNYLLPRDVPRVASGEEEVLKASSLAFSDLMDQLRGRQPQLNLLIVDACRDNPFHDGKGRSIGGGRGLARVQAATGTFVMFSAGAGQVALDRLSDDDPDSNSVYTRTLLKYLAKPGVALSEIARGVRQDVLALTRTVSHVQTPAYYDEVIGRFCPAGCDAQGKDVRPPTSDAAVVWAATKDTTSAAVLKEFIARFPDTIFADLARARLLELLKREEKKVAVGTFPLPSETQKPVSRNQSLIIPSLEFRTGPYAPIGIPLANGWSDYFTLLNERDGGIGGIRIEVASCETGYNTKSGVECYEKLKSRALLFYPPSTGQAYQLIPKAAVDRIPIITFGMGLTAAADGRVFEWAFNMPTNYWSLASVMIKFISQREGGTVKLKGKKIVLIHHNSAYGKEPIETLEALARKHGFSLVKNAVDHPGMEQNATWQSVRRISPDWILLWGWGVMNQVALREAASIGFPRDRMIGVWWSGTEQDVKSSETGAAGYLAGTYHAPGRGFAVHDDIAKYVYDRDKAVDPAFRNRIGEVLYNRGLAAAMWVSEAVRKAMIIHDTGPISAQDVRDGLESLEVDAVRLKALGFEGMTMPIALSCANHMGPGRVAIQQWDGRDWRLVTDFVEPDHAIVAPIIARAAMTYASQHDVGRRDCR